MPRSLERTVARSRDLSASDFVVLENDVPQRITAFVDGEFPASVALAVDRSFSMAGTPLTMARTAGRSFIASLKPDDRAMLVSISGEVEVLAPLSTDKTALFKALDTLDAWSTTSLNDAADSLARSARGRRAAAERAKPGHRVHRRGWERHRRVEQLHGARPLLHAVALARFTLS